MQRASGDTSTLLLYLDKIFNGSGRVDAMMPTQNRLTRRTFLHRSALWGLAVALGPLACVQRSSCSTFDIGADIPARLLFPADAKITSAARLTHLTCVDEVSDVLLQFSGGRTLRWNKGLSFSSRIAQRGGMADRAAVAPKVVAAYALERIGQILRHARTDKIRRQDDEYRENISALSSLRRDFDTFQEQVVLDTVTIGAVYDLALALGDAMHSVSHIVWNAEIRQFVLDSA